MKKIFQKTIDEIKSLSSKPEIIHLITKMGVILLVIIILFFQDLTTIFNDALKNDTTNYILAVPFIFAYLIYRKKEMLKVTIQIKSYTITQTTKHLPLIVGTLLSSIALLLYWYGSYTFTPLEYHILVLPILVSGLILILFNPQTLRQLAFPVAFLLFLIPPPSETLYGIGATLSGVSSEIAYTIVNVLGIPSTFTTEYGNPIITIVRANGLSIDFAVDIACSGIYSLIGFLVFAVFIAYIIRGKFWKRLVLILVGIPIIFSFNLIRITSILLIGYQFGEALALEVFHLLGGWALIFFGTLLLLLISEKILKLPIFQKIARCPKCLHNQIEDRFCFECGRLIKAKTTTLTKNDLIKITAIIIGTILISSIQAPVVSLSQNPTLTINTPSGQQEPTTILPELEGYELKFLYRDLVFEQRAHQDMAVAYLYIPENKNNKPIYVSLEIASTIFVLHRWETCLIRWPVKEGLEARATQIELKDYQLVDNPPLIGRYFVFEMHATNETQAVLYWYETATFIVNSTSQQKHVKISLVIYPEENEELNSIEKQLLTNAKKIAQNWQPIKTWSPIALYISLNGNNLITVPIVILITVVVFYFYDTTKQKRTNFQTYKKLSKPNQEIIDTILETQKTTIPTLNAILITYKNRTGNSIDKKDLLQRISEIEKTGLIKSEIVSNQDVPIQTWRTNIIS